MKKFFADGIHVPVKTLKIAVTRGHLCVDLDGKSACATAAFKVTPERWLALKKQYQGVDGAARQKTWSVYRQRAEELGRELAGILFGTDNGLELRGIFAQCMDGLGDNQYVRVLLSFDTYELATLPWELTLWTPPGAEKEIYLGRDCRLALSRFQYESPQTAGRDIMGEDKVLSILNVGTSYSPLETRLYQQTDEFIKLIGERNQKLRAISRYSTALQQAEKARGALENIDIVHWCGHGDPDELDAGGMGTKRVLLSAGELFELTRRAFLYVVISCASAGPMPQKSPLPPGEPTPPVKDPPDTFSHALLKAGASAVLGMHDTVEQEEFEYLPLLYPLLLHGVPLDYCVQYLRRLFALVNHEFDNGPYDRWYKLILHAPSGSYLDGTPATARRPPGNPFQSVPGLCKQFLQALDKLSKAGPKLHPGGPRPRRPRPAPPARITQTRLHQLETMLNQLEILELCD